MRRHSVVPVQIIFVQAIPFPVSIMKLRQNKSLFDVFINEGARREKLVNFQFGEFEIQDKSMTLKNGSPTRTEQ